MNTPTATPPLSTDTVLALIRAVLQEGFDAFIEPTREVPANYVVRCEVTSPITRGLFTAGQAISLECERVRQEHKKLHACEATNPEPHDCEVYKKKMQQLVERHEVLAPFIKEAIYEEHPAARKGNFKLCKGWKIASAPDEEWPTNAENEASKIADTYVSRLVSIVRGNNLEDPEAFKDPITDVGDRKVIGEITDPAVRSIFVLYEQMIMQYGKLIPAEFSGAVDDKTRYQWFRQQRIGEMEDLMHEIKRCEQARDTIGNFFRHLVYEEVLAAADFPLMVLCKGWKLAEDDSGEIPTILAELIVSSESRVMPMGAASFLARLFAGK